MCKVVIIEYNSFSVDYSESFNLNISILIPPDTSCYHSGDKIAFTLHQNIDCTRFRSELVMVH